MTIAPARSRTILIVVAVLLLALNMRAPVVTVSAVVDEIRADLGISAATAGLLTSLPVLCFGLATPLASVLLARAGLRAGVLAAIGLLVLGTLVRAVDGLPAALAGTLLIGAAITVGNVAVPVVIGRDLPRHGAAMLGGYTAALNVGSMITLAYTGPVAAAAGWRIALASWGVMALVAAAVWWWATRHPAPAAEVPAPPVEPGRGGSGWRRPLTWLLTVAFACQAFTYYGITAWLPLLLRDEAGRPAESAGLAASIFQICGVVGGFAVPLLLRVLGRPRVVAVVVMLCWLALPLGLLLAPGQWALWCMLAGVAQGGGFVVIFSTVVRRARDLAENRQMSALVQGGGYLVAAAAPALIGALHEAGGSWTAPLLVIAATATAFGVLAALAAGPRLTGAAAAPPSGRP